MNATVLDHVIVLGMTDVTMIQKTQCEFVADMETSAEDLDRETD